MSPEQFPAKPKSGRKVFRNPILPGGYPDPSICRVGDDYYLVNSSFEYFPGLPIHHSRDLVNWELIGYGLNRPEQCTGAVNLSDVQTQGGIHAPTIRFHDGIFYIITTNVYLPPGGRESQCNNFIVTAHNPAGPWSEPHVIAGAPGIDPDLFFDDDGRIWYTGTHPPANPNFPGEGEIWMQELDLPNWKLMGECHFVWRGACGGVWVEGPHLYKVEGRYYLMVAEGGTSFNHAVMVAVSDHITGPYVSNPRNPILTSRHLSYEHWVHSTGHADLVELPDGRWYMVALGIRGNEGGSSNMGRETHLIPVTWEREPFEWQESKTLWPVCAPLTGRVERVNLLPFTGSGKMPAIEFVDTFDIPALRPEWNSRRAPLPNSHSFRARPGTLRLFALPEVICERGRYNFLGIRQQESNFTFEAGMAFSPATDGVEAGLVLLQQDENYLKFSVIRQNGLDMLTLVLAEPRQPPRILAQTALKNDSGNIRLQVKSSRSHYTYRFATGNSPKFRPFAKTPANHILSRGYTGAYLGIYASSNGKTTGEYADFYRVRICSRE